MGCKGYKHTALAKARISKAHLGKPKTAGHRQKLREANLGKKLSIETRMRMSAFQTAHPNTGRFKPGGSNPWNRGLKTPEPVKAKMKAAHRTPAQLAIAYATRANQVFPKQDSSIEVALQLELAKRGIPFVKHKAVVPHRATVIELKKGNIKKDDVEQIADYTKWMAQLVFGDDTKASKSKIQPVLIGFSASTKIKQYAKSLITETKTPILLEYKVENNSVKFTRVL